MPEARITSTIDNSDITYVPPTIDNSFSIATCVEANTGPYSLQKISGNPELIRKYLTTAEITNQESDTLKQAAYLNKYNSLYVKRVGSVSFRQGITSLGESLLFNNNYELADKYYSLEIREWGDKLPYYYIGYNGTCYYTGKIEEEDKTGGLDELFTDYVEIDSMKSADSLVAGFLKFKKDEVTVLAVNGMTIITRELLTFSPNLIVNMVENTSVYTVVSNNPFEKVSISDYFQVRGITYYYQGNGSFSPNRYANPSPIFSYNELGDYDSGLFFLKVLKKVKDTSTVYNPAPEIRGDGGFVITYKGVDGKFTISESCEKKLRVLDDGKRLCIFDADEEIAAGFVKLHFHKDPLPPSRPVETNITLNNASGTITSTGDVKAGDGYTVKFTATQLQNSFNWVYPIAVEKTREDTTAKLSANIENYKMGVTHSIKFKQITADEQVQKEIVFKMDGDELKREQVQFTGSNTKDDVVVSLNITKNGVLTAEMADCEFTGDIELTYTDTTNKVRNIVISQGDVVLKEHSVDFTSGNTISSLTIEDIVPVNKNVITVKLENSTFTTPKLTQVYVKPQTDDEKNGIDVKFHFAIGLSDEIPEEGAEEVIFDSSVKNPLDVILAINDTFDFDDESDYIPSDQADLYSYATKGKFEAYFLRRETLLKGNSSETDIKSINITPDGDKITYNFDFMSDYNIKNNLKNTDFYVKINDKVFFVGKKYPAVKTQVKVCLSKEPVTFENFMNLLEDALALYFPDIGMFEGRLTFLSKFTAESDKLEIVKTVNNQQTQAQFAVVQKFSSSDPLFSIKYKKLEDYTEYDVFDMTIGFKDYTSTYDVSFYEDAMDGYKRSLYYDRIDNEYLKIVKLDGNAMLDKLDLYKFGNAVKPKKITVTDYVAAIKSLEKEENKWFDVVWDAGYANPSITQAYDNLAGKKFALNMVSLPSEYSYDRDLEDGGAGYNKLKEYLANLALDSRWSRIVWAKIRDASVGNFVQVINGSTLALRNLIINHNSGSAEFAPQVGVNYGTVDGNHLILPKEDHRNELIDTYRVCSIKGGDGVYAYHINHNTTTQKMKTVFSEEQNVRIANVLQHGLEKIFYKLLGLPNNYFTRSRFTEQASRFIEERTILNKVSGLETYTVICDKTNNSDADIANNIIRAEAYGKFPRAALEGLLFIKSLPLSDASVTTE